MLDRGYQGLNVPAASQAAFLRGFMTSAKGNNGLSAQIQANIQNGGSYTVTRVLNRPKELGCGSGSSSPRAASTFMSFSSATEPTACALLICESRLPEKICQSHFDDWKSCRKLRGIAAFWTVYQKRSRLCEALEPD